VGKAARPRLCPADVFASCSACLLRENATACRWPLRGQNLAWFLARVRPQLLCLHAARERHRLPPAAAWTESAPLPWPRPTAACPAARAAVCRLLVARSAPSTAGADEGGGGGDKVADDDKFFLERRL